MNRGFIAGEKRENVSMIVSTRSLRPVASWSWTKSIAQVSFDRVAGRAIVPQLGLHPALRRFVAQLQAHLAVDTPVDPLRVGPRHPSRRNSTWIRR